MGSEPKRGAIILAGGDNLRMKRDKARLPLGSTTFIEHICDSLKPHFEDILISTGRTGKLPPLPYSIIKDERPCLGPLMGITSTLRKAAYQEYFVIACDIPELDLGLIEKLYSYCGEYDVVVPVNTAGQYEPLYAIYNKRIIPEMDRMLESGNLKLIDLYLQVKTKKVPVEKRDWLPNINTPEDYFRYIKKERFGAKS